MTISKDFMKAIAKMKNPVDSGELVAPHLIILARAGTGKTFTVVEGVNRIFGGKMSRLSPSDQQVDIWDAMSEGRKPVTCGFCAFNKSIATELQRKVPSGVVASTNHSMGLKILRRNGYDPKINQYKTDNLFCHILGFETSRNMRESDRSLLHSVKRLVSLCKLSLAEAIDPDILDEMAIDYDVAVNGQRERIYRLVPEIYAKSAEDMATIDFDDMIFLPVIHEMDTLPYDLLVVDEAQDMNPAQQALVNMMGKRLVLVGDDRQAIYGFAGADTSAILTMKNILDNSELGCETYPLTTTYRCGKAIVRAAKKIVPDYEAYKKNPEGSIYSIPEKQLLDVIKKDDMILCRTNGPLVRWVFLLLRHGIKAIIQGRDIGKNLTALIKKLNPESIEDLEGLLDDYQEREVQRIYARANPNDMAVLAMEDKCDCIRAFMDGCATIEEVVDRIDQMFTDNETSGVLLSSIHRAKGLEANRVFVLEPQNIPHPMAKSASARQQEWNLKYVAITRAIKELIWVISPERE